jgi:hypothetical protein
VLLWACIFQFLPPPVSFADYLTLQPVINDHQDNRYGQGQRGRGQQFLA